MSLAFFHCARTGRLPVCDSWSCCRFFFFTDTATTEIYTAQYTLSLHDALPILVIVGPLIFAGISVAIAYRAGLFNIGAEGQLAVGAITVSAIGLHATHWPGWLLIPTLVIAGALAGAIWGGIAGALKAWRGAHEVVTTIMLNWIAF